MVNKEPIGMDDPLDNSHNHRNEKAEQDKLRDTPSDRGNHMLSDSEKEQLWSSIQAGITARHSKTRLVRWTALAGAASVFLALSIGWWLIDRQHVPEETALLSQLAKHVSKLPVDTSGQIQLMMGDGRIIHLEDESTLSYRDSLLEINHQGTQAYHQLQAPEASQFHILYVPYGRRMEVGLPDGSTVWLNAGSTLTFPAAFAADRREVYIAGEGYFDIKHQAHQPFVVHTKDVQINVTGTSFNVSAYEDDAYTATLLVEGSITLKSSKPDMFKQIRMKPGNKATFNRENATLSLDEDGGEDDVSWRKRQLVFQRKSMPEIVKKIERVYNASIDVAGGDRDSRTFSGSLDLSKPIREVLSYLYNTDEYSIIQQERRIAIRRK
ncbi:FecR family protein [Parapedobacter deserti]|uniref:FecR family protein n=1 Tax=Parapedobacter deserti TaxID=1912957 RepID=A0ABV7JNZ3_9SPHI